jgi:hypothetical protein
MKLLGLVDVTFDNVFAIVTVRARGAELLASLPKAPIGFRPAAG